MLQETPQVASLPAPAPAGPFPRERIRTPRLDAAGYPDKPLSWVTRAKFALVRGFLRAWTWTFSLRGLYLFGQFFGTMEYLVNFKRRRRYRRELAHVFPDGLRPARTKRIVLSYFRRTRCDKLFYLVMDRLPQEKFLRRLRFHGKEHLDEALARGRGVYFMFSHHGPQHVAGLLMAILGYRGAILRDPNEGAMRVYMRERFARRFPAFAESHILYVDSYPRDIYRVFQQNRVVGSALDVARDRGANLKTCPVTVFGQRREYLTGTLRAALRCGATILQGFVISRPNYYFRIVARPLYVPPPGGETRADPQLIAELMQKYASGIEEHVRHHPDHLSRV